ncbi:MAG: hypothetical protein ABL867_02025 [Rickettsiales bacterium]
MSLTSYRAAPPRVTKKYKLRTKARSSLEQLSACKQAVAGCSTPRHQEIAAS